MTRLALAALAVLAVGSGCEGRKSEPSGIGNYKFGRTTRANIRDGICQPTELTDGRKATWCFALPPVKVGKRVAEVDAYFLGTEPPDIAQMTPEQQKEARNALPLIELQLKVRGCVEDETERWMRERFGPPIESKSTRVYWKNSFLWAAAFLPSEPGRCLIHFLPLSENAEIERIKQQ
ncbi:MAG: hypothetical protein HOV81_26215 [Kofleriaceae bacterium]|nr:hypothetical protein [Kofleriaceae bacterium]